LMVVIDIFMTDTTRMADIVLPSTTFLERLELRDYLGRGFSLVTLANKAIEPVGNSMGDWRIWAELGKRMGYAEYFPWNDDEELLRHLLELAPISFEEFKQKPGGVYYAEPKFKKYLEGGFNTPSKKVEIYSETLAQLGIDPIPTFREPLESPVSRPELVEKYPLVLTTGARSTVYLHSGYRNLPSLRELQPEPFIEINPETASSLGIADGSIVTVESPRGSIKIKAKLTEDVHPRVVSIQMGWSEANVNFLTSNETSEPVLGLVGLRSVVCRVTKA